MKYLVTLLCCLLAGTTYAAQQSSVTQYGITWYFDKDYEVGQYVTGDWWVLGPVTVDSVYPAPADGRNGSSLNGIGNAVRGLTQGYDSRADKYYETARTGFPLAFEAGNSLVSTISHTSLPNESVLEHFELSNSYLKTAAALTCVADTPAAGAFRPPYYGPEKPVYHLDSLRWDKLPGLADISGTGYRDLARYTRAFERLWLDHSVNFQSRSYHPTDNMPDYGREIGRAVGMAGSILLLDIPREELEPLMIGLVQKGIDYFYMAKIGIHWPGEGGHGSGRKLPILFAGVMLDDTYLMDVNQFNTYFSEDDQTYYYDDPKNQERDKYGNLQRGVPGWTGATVLYDMVHWGHARPRYEHLPPEQWYQFPHIPSRNNEACTAESYRRCCCSLAWIGQCLTAWFIGARDLWGHDAFFDYCDRWMTEKDTDDMKQRLTAACGGVGQLSGEVWDDLVKYMWAQYRSRMPASSITAPGSRTERENAFTAVPSIISQHELTMLPAGTTVYSITGRPVPINTITTGVHLLKTDNGTTIPVTILK